MTIQAWTFLISRNQSIDYKTVVAPDFISQAKIRSLLAKVSDDDFTESGQISMRSIQGSEVGNFTVVFRSVKARRKDIGEKGNEVLKDLFGREIYWVEGLVFQKSPKELRHKIGESHLERAHIELQEKYSEFWNEDRPSVSHAIDLVEVTSEPDNKLRVLEPLAIAPRTQLPEHRLPEKQGGKNYPPSKFVRGKASIFRLVSIAITALLLIGILGILLRSQPTSICLYVTQDVPIKFSQPNQTTSLPGSQKPSKESVEVLSGIEGLKKLRNKHQTAWIWLNGSLEVETSLVNQIENELKKHNGKTKIENITIVPEGKKQFKLNHHPIDSAIALLQNQTVTSGELHATIIDPISPKASSCDGLLIE